MITKKNGTIDRRFKVNKTLETKEFLFWQKYGNLVAAVILGALAGVILGKTVWDSSRPKNTSPNPLGQTIEVKEVQAEETPFCFDSISCIRDIGEEMGFSNQEIITAIKIAKCESGLRPDALNKNKNGTFDVGVMQINDVHGKRISRADRMDFEKNIRFAWTLRKEQGNWNAWSCYKLINK